MEADWTYKKWPKGICDKSTLLHELLPPEKLLPEDGKLLCKRLHSADCENCQQPHFAFRFVSESSLLETTVCGRSEPDKEEQSECISPADWRQK